MWSWYEILDAIIILIVLSFGVTNTIFIQIKWQQNKGLINSKAKKVTLISLISLVYFLTTVLLIDFIVYNVTINNSWLIFNIIQITTMVLILLLVPALWIIYLYQPKKRKGNWAKNKFVS
ncbi:hypothetical protein SSYRP_v1c05380 [Spiroplasma syrphidicola EA-1]|uniref:Transmembrane protein n=1 Tax=Spiroplasma syrphidicola EA-1 TaxID=1276229 RepID=R4U6B8_9MOLU|nr:hypothetical protein [Spiroplasma syrphidicola]AGM26128.1 hypothetical protein SSYRP_v1c05380 [Spiroplasma syrphidicola EA-1]